MFRLLYCIVAAGTALSNSVAETSLASNTFPANSFAKGKAYHCEGSVRATATNSTDTLTVGIELGTTATGGTALGTTGAVDVANNDVVTWELDLYPRDVAGSTTGVIAVRGLMTVLGAEGTVTARAVHEIWSGSYAAAQILSSNGTWSVASASNSAQAETFACYQLN